MIVYRITHKSYSEQLYATGFNGRWNSVGKKVIYSAESIALAFLESMVRRQGVGFNNDFKIMLIEVPDELKIKTIEVAELKGGWRNFKDYSQCQALGDEWYQAGVTALLKVPSAVLPEAYNFVINSTHPHFKKVKLIETTNLIPDDRIEEILKKYAAK